MDHDLNSLEDYKDICYLLNLLYICIFYCLNQKIEFLC